MTFSTARAMYRSREIVCWFGRSRNMPDFRIRARIEPAGTDTFVAKVWVFIDGEEIGGYECADVADICHPCSRDQAKASCKQFVDEVARHLKASGHRISEISITG